jgi:sugar-specific transcriptional regulator TrmB
MKPAKDKKTILANTFTPLYDELEDRIRIVVNYQDIQNRIDFVITRNFIINLIPAIDEFIEQHYSDNLLIDNDVIVDTKIDQEKNKNLEKTDNSNLELLHLKDELLTKINLSYQPDTKKVLLTCFSNESKSQALLDAMMFQQLIKSIKIAIPYFKWGISHKF